MRYDDSSAPLLWGVPLQLILHSNITIHLLQTCTLVLKYANFSDMILLQTLGHVDIYFQFNSYQDEIIFLFLVLEYVYQLIVDFWFFCYQFLSKFLLLSDRKPPLPSVFTLSSTKCTAKICHNINRHFIIL